MSYMSPWRQQTERLPFNHTPKFKTSYKTNACQNQLNKMEKDFFKINPRNVLKSSQGRRSTLSAANFGGEH